MLGPGFLCDLLVVLAGGRYLPFEYLCDLVADHLGCYCFLQPWQWLVWLLAWRFVEELAHLFADLCGFSRCQCPARLFRRRRHESALELRREAALDLFHALGLILAGLLCRWRYEVGFRCLCGSWARVAGVRLGLCVPCRGRLGLCVPCRDRGYRRCAVYFRPCRLLEELVARVAFGVRHCVERALDDLYRFCHELRRFIEPGGGEVVQSHEDLECRGN